MTPPLMRPVLVYFCLWITGSSSLYFPLDILEVEVPVYFPSNYSLVRVVAAKGPLDDPFLTWNYSIVSTKPNNANVDIHRDEGTLFLTHQEQARGTGQIIYVNVSATPASPGVPAAFASVVLSFAKATNGKWCNECPCFLPTKCELSVSENEPAQVIASLVDLKMKIEENFTYEINGTDLVSVNSKNGLLSTVVPVDREETQKITFQLRCNATSSGDRNATYVRQEITCTVAVGDVNDSGPDLVNSGKMNFTFKEELEVGQLKLPHDILVYDADSSRSNYSAYIRNNSDGFFKLNMVELTVRKTDQDGIYRHAELILLKPLKFEGDTYQITLVFQDDELPTEYGKQATLDVIFNKFVWTPMLEKYEASIYSNATKYARLLGPCHKNVSEEGVRFSLDVGNNKKLSSVFTVTPTDGVVFLQQPERLVKFSNKTVNLKLRWTNRKNLSNHTLIQVKILQGTMDSVKDQDVSNDNSEYSFCAKKKDQYSCIHSSGLGSSVGTCSWWSKANAFTCSPNTLTCPDETCDDLEKKEWSLCPQDCIENDDSKDGVGFSIKDNIGHCWCEINSKQCHCFHVNSEEPYANQKRKSTNNSTTESELMDEKSKPDNVSSTLHILSIDSLEASSCDGRCVLFLVTGVSLTGVVVAAFVSAWCIRHRRKKRTGRPKYLGSAISLSAVPSDYVDERSASVVSQTVTMIDALLTSAVKLHVPIDSRWEFPRSQLIIEQTLGEGEFGRVMRAKAFGIAGKPGFSTVAVKMLKSNGTSTEFQDLLSEYNLLKEVTHPNVIKLLGACTLRGGPLYIIVEYAEHGSLRTYLRKSRQLEFDTYASEDSGVGSLFIANAGGSNVPGTREREYQVEPRDLLSFMWQISKGMAYLSEMKVVHRDLATRNLLIAAGKLIKISDFGLSRDVYEGDTYFKTSKGRVPVKWMAIESLINHIYTSKSDVWSFGVVMWEIVMLGATPYPGVPPERLFHLLKSGYRMEKPDNSSDELYNIMLQCWKENPHERPSFRELTNKFDRMLQDNVEYLDLGFNTVHNMTYFESQSFYVDDEDDDEITEINYGSMNGLPTGDESGYLVQQGLGDTENRRLLPLASTSHSPRNESRHKRVMAEAVV